MSNPLPLWTEFKARAGGAKIRLFINYPHVAKVQRVKREMELGDIIERAISPVGEPSPLGLRPEPLCGVSAIRRVSPIARKAS
jgi:hypothetical protein